MHPPTRILLILSILLSLLPIGRIIGQGPEYKQDIRDWNASVTIGAGELHRILLPVVHARWRMTEVSVSPYVPRFGLALTQGFLPIHKPGSGNYWVISRSQRPGPIQVMISDSGIFLRPFSL